MSADSTDKLKRQKAAWQRFAIEALVTLIIHTVVALLMIALIFVFGRFHGDLTQNGSGQYLFWSGVGLATGTTFSACGIIAMLFRKLAQAQK